MDERTWPLAEAQEPSISCAEGVGHPGASSPESRVRELVAGALCALLVAAAQVRAEERKLHEYVPNIDVGEASIGKDPLAAGRGGEGAQAGGPLSAEAGPAYEATRGDGTPGEPAGRRTPSFRPDRLTELSSSLDYYEVFRPAIAPWKRVSALGAIRLDGDGKTPVFFARSEAITRVRIEGEASAPPDARPRDRFSAELDLDFGAGTVVPLPSVSPESRLLSLSTTPKVALQIERDADDNFAARLLSPTPDRPVRVRFVTDAPRSYFGAEIPHGRVSGLELAVPTLEHSIERRGLAMAKRLGLTRNSDLRAAIETLTEYFRGFEESSSPPDNTGDLYLDLVRSRKGICRHRAYGFVVTAQALGIPARFVQNEAHSWVEVKLPRLGFMRIDLGGAAHGLTAHNVADAPSYVPSLPDPLPQPASYRRSVAQAAARATGPRPQADGVMGRWLSADESVADERGEMQAAQRDGAPDEAAGEPAPQRGDKDREAGARASAGLAPENGGARPQQGETAAQSGTRRERLALSIQLHDRRFSALRGTQLSLAGRVVDPAAQGVAGLRVEAWIAEGSPTRRMLLGVCVTDDRGNFEASLGIPSDLRVGDYKLLVMTPGNAQYAASVAN
jgi:transglutaminase-like putative cysteine protease